MRQNEFDAIRRWGNIVGIIMLRAECPRIRSSAADPDFFQRLYRKFPPSIQLPEHKGGCLINLRPAPNLEMSEATSPLPTCLNGMHNKKFTFNPKSFPLEYVGLGLNLTVRLRLVSELRMGDDPHLFCHIR